MELAGRTTRVHRRARRSLTLAEAVVSIAIVGVMLVAALNTAGASRTTQAKMSDRSRGLMLAQDLMSEILQQAYTEPDVNIAALGEDTGENSGKRDRYDDVDDYHGWSASPPQQKDGTVFSGFDTWRRSVRVSWVKSADLAVAVPFDSGVKEIVVTVARNDVVTTTLVAIRTNVGDLALETR